MNRFSKSIWIIAALGVIIRLVSFLQNRSLWLDEISLALNVMQRTFEELAKPPLLLHQMAPIGFVFLSKAVVNVLGFDEMALRLVPLLAALASVVIFPFVAEKCLRREAIPYAMAYCALSFGLIYYSNEFKQYSLDALATLLLYLVGLSILHSEKPKFVERIVQLLTVIFTCLTSFASYFVSLSLLIVVVPYALVNKHWQKLAFITLIATTIAVCSYGIYNTSFSVIDPDARASFNSDWRRAHAFMPLPLPGDGHLIWFLTKTTAPLLMVHPSAEMQGLLAFLWLVGAASIFRGCRWTLALLLLPAALALITSHFRIYPWSGRFLVFLAPMVCLFLGEGTCILSNSLRKKTPIVAGMLLTFLFAGLVVVDAYDMAFVGSKENPRSLFQYIQENGNSYDVLYLYDHSAQDYTYYSRTIDLGNPTVESGKRSDPEFFHEHFPDKKVWVVYSKYASGLNIGDALRAHFRVIDVDYEKGMEALLIDCSTYR